MQLVFHFKLTGNITACTIFYSLQELQLFSSYRETASLFRAEAAFQLDEMPQLNHSHHCTNALKIIHLKGNDTECKVMLL